MSLPEFGTTSQQVRIEAVYQAVEDLYSTTPSSHLREATPYIDRGTPLGLHRGELLVRPERLFDLPVSTESSACAKVTAGTWTDSPSAL